MNAQAFDLIPASYRAHQKTLRITKRTIAVLILVICVGSAAAVFYYLRSNSLLNEIEELEHRQQISLGLQKEADLLNTALAELQVREKLLLGLRSGAGVPALITAVENSIPAGDVWLREWRFVRSGIVTDQQQEPRPASFFVRSEFSPPLADWQALTHMNVRGQATDHQALSRFSKELLGQDGVADVTVQRTSSRQTSSSEQRLIEFELKVLVKTEVQK